MLQSATAPTTVNKESPIVVMQRYELKYVLDAAQCERLRQGIAGRMHADCFGRTAIASVYYDTPDYLLIRSSVEKPAFKEKIRLRAYGLATEDSTVFLELKRKACGIVYKRRVPTTVRQAAKFFDREGDVCGGGQINREITYFRDYYGTLAPSCLIIYDRTAYVEQEGDLRLTIDEDPRYRTDDITLTSSMEGTSLLPPGGAILEIKVQSAVPRWLSELLCSAGIYQNSFSKYGEAYRQQILKLNGKER